MPDFVGSGSTDADFRSRRVNASPRPPPLVQADQTAPGCGRGEDLPEPLSKHGQGPRRHTTVPLGSDHLLDRVHFSRRQLMRRDSWTRESVVEATLPFPLPRMIAGLRQLENAEDDPQREGGTRALDGSKQRALPRFIRNPGIGERKPRDLQQHDQDPQQRNQPFDAFSKCEYLPLEAEEVFVGVADGDDLEARRVSPSASRRAGNASLDGVFDVPGRPNQLAKAMVVSALSANRCDHASMITTAAHRSTRNDENSRRKLQNVVAERRAKL